MPSSSRKGNQFGWPPPFRFEPWEILISIEAKSTEKPFSWISELARKLWAALISLSHLELRRVQTDVVFAEADFQRRARRYSQSSKV